MQNINKKFMKNMIKQYEEQQKQQGVDKQEDHIDGVDGPEV